MKNSTKTFDIVINKEQMQKLQTVYIFDAVDVWTTKGLLGSIFGFIGLGNTYEKTAILERSVEQTTFDFP